jgi:hypothetical protein
MTAKELAQLLLPFGDLPVRLVVDVGPRQDRIVTMIEADAVRISAKSAQPTERGDVDVCRLVIEWRDNA